MKKIVIYFVIWLVVVNLFSLVVSNRLNLSADTAYPWIDPSKAHQSQSGNVLDLHANWDSAWYLDIAQNGYSYNGSGLANVVFFPLYPMLVKLVSFIFFGNVLLAGWLVSSVFLLLSAIMLYKLVKEFHPKLNAELAVISLFVFPTAIFFNAIYTESLFMFLSISAFYFALKKDYKYAGLFGAAAALTRVTGVLLFIPLLIEYLQAKNYSVKKDAFPLLLIPLAAASFFIFHWLKFSDLFLFFKVQSAWGRNFSINQDHFTFLTNSSLTNFGLDLMYISVAIVSAFLVYKKLRTSYAAYMLLMIGVALSTGTLMSIGRYILVLFPMFISVAAFKNDVVQKTWIFISLLLFSLNILLYVNYYWAG